MAIRAGHIGRSQGLWRLPEHSPHTPDLMKIEREVREAQQSEFVLASHRPMMLFIGRLEYSNVLRVVDQLLTSASYLIE